MKLSIHTTTTSNPNRSQRFSPTVKSGKTPSKIVSQLRSNPGSGQSYPSPGDGRPFGKVIDWSDSSLLQKIYSYDFPSKIMTSFLQMSISLPMNDHQGLRHAALAIASYLLPGSLLSMHRCESHKDKALKALQRTVTNPSNSDIFATLLLAKLANLEKDGVSEALVHLEGCISIVHHISTHSKESFTTDMLQAFNWLLLDVADYLEPLASWQLISKANQVLPQMTFSRLSKFFEIYAGPLLGGPRAMLCTLGFLLRTCVAVTQRRLSEERLDEDVEQKIIRDIEAQLDDAEFLQALHKLDVGPMIDPQFPVQCRRCVWLLVAILKHPTIWEGFNDPSVTQMAKIVISHYRSLATQRQRFPIVDSMNISYIDLLLCGGLALKSHETPERKSSFLLLVDNSKFANG